MKKKHIVSFCFECLELRKKQKIYFKINTWLLCINFIN